jgi:hypothetical protein
LDYSTRQRDGARGGAVSGKPDYHIIRVYETKYDPDPVQYVFDFGDEVAINEAANNLKDQMEAGLIRGFDMRYAYEFAAVEVVKQEKLL